MRLPFAAWLSLAVCLLSLTPIVATAVNEGIVSRNLADPVVTPWTQGAWNSANGSFAASEERPNGATAADAPASMAMTVTYSGGGFEFFGGGPAAGAIPGDAQAVTGWVKGGGDGYGWALKFKDADGNEKLGDRKLEYGLKTKEDVWQSFRFKVPADWKRPLTFVGVASHNWGAKERAATVTLLLNDLRFETDVRGVSDRAGLTTASLSMAAPRHLFTPTDPVRAQVLADSWLGELQKGKLTWRIVDEQGKAQAKGEEAVELVDAWSRELAWDAKAFGPYTLETTLTLGTTFTMSKAMKFAYIPDPPARTAAEKKSSPYGINIHGGNTGTSYEGIARNGIAWIRDYAYSREWMLKARGDDGKYGGWPWYPRMDKRVQDAGLMLLPCLMKSIDPYVQAGKMEPDKAWKIDTLQILMAFPQYVAWEADNEYDLHRSREETARNWTSYDAYHKGFAETLRFLDDKVWVVENGTAGLHPDRVRQSIARGAFDNVDVVNGHFYAGIEPPELSTRNANTGGEFEVPALLYDELRELVAAADSDGRDRQTWITEFGWDTLAVHIVTEAQQAAYLQRGYLLGFQAGMDKMFWYWNLDTKKEPDTFFDGCGIYDPHDEPKPAAVALSALVHMLPKPEPVGTFDVGPGTFGHVFRDGETGELVACVYMLQPQDAPVTVTVAAGDLYDLYGNPLRERTQTLGLAPLWIRGLPATDPMVLAADYDLASRYFHRAAQGDSVTLELRVRNRRATPINATASLDLPPGWTVATDAGPITVAPGATALRRFVVKVAADAAKGAHTVGLKVAEPGVAKTMACTVMVVPDARLMAAALTGAPGTSPLEVRVTNDATVARAFVLQASVPEGWTAVPAERRLEPLEPGASTTARFDVTWAMPVAGAPPAMVQARKADAAATPVVPGATGVIAATPIIPNAIGVPRVDGLKLDGDFSDWPAAAQLPAWMLGTVGEAPPMELRLGWAPEGLYVGVKVANTKVKVDAPKAFWGADSLELFLDSKNDKTDRGTYKPTDHQFFFVPLVDEGTVFGGRWKRHAEIPETRYALDGLKGHSLRVDGGYAMEFLIPAAQIFGWKAAPGTQLGADLIVSVPVSFHGRVRSYWPQDKEGGAAGRPALWGTLELR